MSLRSSLWLLSRFFLIIILYIDFFLPRSIKISYNSLKMNLITFDIITNFCNYDDMEAINNRKKSEKIGKNRKNQKRSESVVTPDTLYKTLSSPFFSRCSGVEFLNFSLVIKQTIHRLHKLISYSILGVTKS